MRKDFLVASARTLGAAAALAILISLGLVHVTGPAMAKPMTCSTKVAACNERCTVRYRDDGDAAVIRCNRGTCLHQYKNCISNAAGGSDRSRTGAGGKNGGRTGPIVRDKRNPRPGRGADSTPITRPTPMVQPRPVTRGTDSSNIGQRTVRDHRSNRAGQAGQAPSVSAR